ncbi:MAG TPA: hypothetical protein VN026_14970 [Bacteroidia bacterium]|jgi:hypothetical protein|nr:hypothetical protein [Bacteroidia bacterium]
MEKSNTNTNRSEGVFNETTQMTNKWLSDTCSAMTNIYDKQLKATLSFYNGLFDSLSGAARQNTTNSFPSFFNGNEFLNLMTRPFNPFSVNSNWFNFFSGRLEEIQKQISEYNNRLFSIFQEDVKNRQANRDEFNKLIEEEWKAMQNITKTFQETYVKQLNQSFELNKKLCQEINNQFTLAADRNKKYWSDLMKTEEFEEETKTEAENRNGQTKKNYKTEFAHSKV